MIIRLRSIAIILFVFCFISCSHQTSNFDKYLLDDIGHIYVPKNMRLISKDELRELRIHNNRTFSFLPKVNTNNAALTISTEFGEYGDFEKLSDNWTLTIEELNEFVGTSICKYSI